MASTSSCQMKGSGNQGILLKRLKERETERDQRKPGREQGRAKNEVGHVVLLYFHTVRTMGTRV